MANKWDLEHPDSHSQSQDPHEPHEWKLKHPSSSLFDHLVPSDSLVFSSPLSPPVDHVLHLLSPLVHHEQPVAEVDHDKAEEEQMFRDTIAMLVDKAPDIVNSFSTLKKFAEYVMKVDDDFLQH
ncbi:hypothetical protein P9112_010036 [Eukaryota sp. TZLM1-RC]